MNALWGLAKRLWNKSVAENSSLCRDLGFEMFLTFLSSNYEKQFWISLTDVYYTLWGDIKYIEG